MLMDINRRAYYSDPLSKEMKLVAVLLFHGIVTTGVAILAVGVSNLESSDVRSSDASTNASLVKVGIALLTLSWAIIAIASVWTLARPATCSKSKSATAAGTKVSIPYE